MTYSWVEKPTTDTEEHPNVDHETEPKDQTDVKQDTRVRSLRDAVPALTSCCSITVQGRSVGDLGTAKCEEEEQESTAEFCYHCDKLVPPFAREAPLLLLLFVLLWYDMPIGSLAFLMVVVMVVCRICSLSVALVQWEYVLESHFECSRVV